MNAQLSTNQLQYDVLDSSEMSHYMTLDEIHERLTAKIRKAFFLFNFKN